MGKITRRRVGGLTGAALAACLLVTGCGGSSYVPNLDEVPPQVDADGQVMADDQTLGEVEHIVGVVTAQDVEYGDRVEDGASGDTLVEALLVVTVDPTDEREPIEVEIPRGYVPYPPADAAVDPLGVGSDPVEFTVRARSDGRYECAGLICIAAPG